MGEIAVEAYLRQDGADSGTLDAFALFQGEVGGHKTVDEAGEPNVPVGRVCFGAGKEGMLDSVGPCATLFEHLVVLGGVGAGRGFHVTKGLVSLCAVAMSNDCDLAGCVLKMNEMKAEILGRAELAFAVFPVPADDII